jgi:ribokinase
MNKQIVILGSINYDITASAERLPAKGETVNGFSVDMFGGGKGANQAVQSAQMGIPTVMLGQIGNDMQGKFVLDALKSKGVDCSHLNISETNRTGCTSIYVDPNGDNTLVYAPGANHHITKEMIDAGKDIIEQAGVFLTQAEINLDAAVYSLKLAHDAGAVTILNPAPAIPLPDEIFPLVDFITPNETESEVYTGILRSDMSIEEWKTRTADWFLGRGVRNLCITMGEKGAFYSNGTESISVPAFSIKAVDTTAAGDSFHGGLAYGLANGYNIETCLKIGSACGALSAMTLGAQNSIQPQEQVLAFLKERGVIL